MKESAIPGRDRSQESSFQRFAKATRALIAVPKHELAAKMAEDKQRKGQRQNKR
jgi:hypothetical protein